MTIKRIAAFILALVMVFTLTGCKSSDYKKAMALFDEGNFSEAQAAFEALGDYKDSLSYAENIGWYAVRAHILENGKIEYEATETLMLEIDMMGDDVIVIREYMDEDIMKFNIQAELSLGETVVPYKADIELIIEGASGKEAGVGKLDIASYKEGDSIKWDNSTCSPYEDLIILKDFSGPTKTFVENTKKAIEAAGINITMAEFGFESY
ncbi:MAG: hypothetical protein IJP38_09600 [Oscillospiraceae bacterium]|nr:hypothetical protein [Oscillospiraceae bacterium]